VSRDRAIEWPDALALLDSGAPALRSGGALRGCVLGAHARLRSNGSARLGCLGRGVLPGRTLGAHQLGLGCTLDPLALLQRCAFLGCTNVGCALGALAL